jgi:hypothetical protein
MSTDKISTQMSRLYALCLEVVVQSAMTISTQVSVLGDKQYG